MMLKSNLSAALLLVPLVYTATAAVAQDAPFVYSEDWRLVSAPPPPGPYTAVNIDPRVPRQEAIPLMTSGDSEWEESLPAEVLDNPPAAGSPAYPPTPRSAMPIETPGFDAPGYETPAPLPGTYEHGMPRPPGPAGMPPPQPHTSYGNMPPSGYYRSPAMPQEEEVPPPPVYDALTGESDAGYYRP